jgi:hypothetical protein
MQLKSLYISLDEWGANKGRLTGAVKFASGAGEVSLNLNHDDCLPILKIVSKAMVSAARDVSLVLAEDILEQTSQYKALTPPAPAPDETDLVRG